MRISQIREKTSEALLDFAWRQWAQAGVSASVTDEDRRAMDPEALILFTIGLARRDPRLFDEMLDWIALNHKLLSMQRLRNLTRRSPVDGGLVAAVIAWTRPSVPMPLQKDRDLPAGKTPVFDREVVGFMAKTDPSFEEFGFVRPPVARSGKSREPDAMLPANLAFALRHLFGPGSRSEVLRVLLTYQGGALDASLIADEAGFSKRNASDALTSLASAGAIAATWSGNERHFAASRETWSAVLGRGEVTDLPVFVSWVHLLPTALEILLWLDSEASSTDSGYLLASRARELTSRLTASLQSAGVEVPRGRLAHGADYLPVFEEINASLLDRFRADG